ncbi:hypothetical protein [Streptomyces sp. Root431]|uniref:hypothetical protein n=1 Tax=Streptomyces sp. Root431 TaxID=1736535 RepID=UPI001F5BAB90|nr:hypothetical protein [Streptomyces sp. Root431]
MVEASSEETGVAGTPVDDVTEAGAESRTETEITVESEAGAEVRVEVGAGTDTDTGAADVVEATAKADADDAADDADAAEGLGTDEEAAGAVASEVVEIPKQQSAEAAADNEAGEGARK